VPPCAGQNVVPASTIKVIGMIVLTVQEVQ